jgi:PhnB protein
VQLSAYLFLYGKCEEAMEFYKAALGGELEMNRQSDSPQPVPAGWEQKIMHATLRGDGFELMASDGGPDSHQEKESNISLCIAMADEAKARDVYAKLSAGGKATMPMEQQFWGAIFGTLTDKYGIDWMINCFPKG